MKNQTALKFVLIALAAVLSVAPTFAQRVHFAVGAGSTLTLKGSSTFHDYECSTDSVRGTIEGDTSGLAKNSLDSVFIHAKIEIPVKSLHGSSDGITSNMADALKGKDFPLITFVLTQCAAAPDSAKKTGVWSVKTKGNLTIAGKTKPIDMIIRLTSVGKGTFRLEGSHNLIMTDYGVDPPSFMLGAMKTNPKVSIHFDLKLKAH